MPHIPLLYPASASPEVQDLYEDFRLRMLFPAAPNFILTQGHSRSAARGSWDLVRSVLVGGEIPRWTKEMIFAAISKDRDCRYCAAAHIACCRMLGVEPDLLERLVRDVHAIADVKLRDTILFAVKCARDPQGLTDADYETLRRHGLPQSAIMEVVAMSALAVYANIIADATGVEADAMFDQV
jgi:uncharacterized peroxidase-related enzyme